MDLALRLVGPILALAGLWNWEKRRTRSELDICRGPIQHMRSIAIERDLAVPMRDGVRLFANLFRPAADRPYPVIMSVTPYGKDKLPDRLATFFMRLSGVKFGKLNCSRLTGFEVTRSSLLGAAGLRSSSGGRSRHAQIRGTGGSPQTAGRGRLLRPDRMGGIPAVVYGASRPDGCFVSGHVAMVRGGPQAAAPACDRSVGGRHRSIPRTRVPWRDTRDEIRSPLVQEADQARAQSQISAGGRFPGRERSAIRWTTHTGRRNGPILENIEVPALVCASWSDHGLHTRGSIEGFERISSRQKWLFTHGRKKWETFYGEEALAWQKRFLDHFLRDVDNGMDRVPKVRLEVRKAYYEQEVRSEESWPLSSVQPALLYLCANTGSLQREPVASEGKVQYRPASSKRAEQFFLSDSSGRLN